MQHIKRGLSGKVFFDLCILMHPGISRSQKTPYLSKLFKRFQILRLLIGKELFSLLFSLLSSK